MSYVEQGPRDDTSLNGLLARGSVRKPFAIYPFLQCELQRATNGLLPAARLPAYVTVSPFPSLPLNLHSNYISILYYSRTC